MNVIGRLSKEKKANREIFIALSAGNIKARTGTGIFCRVENENDDRPKVQSWFNYVTGETKSPFAGKRKLTDEDLNVKDFHEKAHKDYEGLKVFINEKIAKTDKFLLSSAWLKQCVDEHRQTGIFKPKTLLEHVNDFIEKYPETIISHTGKKVSSKNIRLYNMLKDSLQKFAVLKGKKDFEITELDENFITDFTKYLQDLNYAVNTCGLFLRIFKAVLNKYGLYNPHITKISPMKEKVYNPYLTEIEINQIRLLDITNPTLDRARNTFLLLCYTGSRVSDLNKILNNPIIDNKITVTQQKTGTQVVIPLIYKDSQELIDKCKTKGIITNSRLNGYIKKIGELAGIKEIFVKTQTQGGTRKDNKTEKCKLITSHTGRRSYCTNLHKKGISDIQIMKISGHKSHENFLNYIKISNEENANLILERYNQLSN
jgi:integrase